MDFGVLGLDHGLGVSTSSSSEAGFSSHIVSSSSDLETKQSRNLYGSGFCSKQDRSESITALDDYWLRSCKLSKTGSDADLSASKAMLHQRNSSLLRSNSTSLSFLDSAAHPHHQMLSFSSPKPENVASLYFPNALSAYNSRNFTGFNSGSLVNGFNMHGEKGPFTPSQWIELEQQALIYKYIIANIPVPSSLLIPIRKPSDSFAFSSFPTGLHRPNSFGWGGFHLGFSNNSDPEPGRCRRTDGKKWRCSRDAVADQKYCERHMNRGRHRSRKPVEGQTGQSLAGANAASTINTSTASSSPAASLGRAASNSLGASNSSAATVHMNRMQSSHGGLSLLSSTTSDHFGLVKSESQHSLRQFIDWPNKTAKPNNNNNQTTVPNWPDSDRIQLSMSISGMSSSDSNLEQNTASADHRHHNQHQRQALNLIPMSWEPSLGGPLGEVLHHTNNNNNKVDSGDSKRPLSSVLNLMTENWDSSPPMGSSPTGVNSQMTAFGSLSNSSAGSSPRADNNRDLACAHLNSSSSL